ncbi:ankyrin repeat and SOCS box protein 5b isoform X3 [Brienomyrus brachyistius]|uniref:ankyrin repeat and SOCS box protein 5b isoform X3 n=1 Tax=Brienomyrus brachyistius TaxID=42636 RepID=UPI0020B3334C|nr:ankyrin repeat and SOCS box protein 5b isoform X3 [Brienomyrus brachyistius]
MTDILESRPFGSQFSNVYLTIFALFCFKLFIKISLNILTHFYIVKGNRKEAARIAAEFYDFGQGHRSWADRSPLHEAACQGRLLALRTLLSQGYSANIFTIDHVTPLHEACLGDHVACARALIDAGANVNATTIDGVTPLFNACSAGSVACTEVLLEHSAKPQAEPCQPSPIHEASSKGANVQKGRFLETPLHAAAQKDCPEIVKELLEYGANINSRNLELKRPVEAAPPSSLAEGLLLLCEATPSPLRQLCRLAIRQCIGRSRLHLIPQLQLPTLLKKFLQYR